ncbi:hypothetical protein KUTeg_023247 [Tegillarca granosa]|uniref:Uncharacterized protein n=1 Tax=Tegillarca granosa TaxID=220873 RepID=A0ABQ9E6L8_TEGGR|nr:hypothetical protein KUTeg_023247 [Tegillarca granosa]
MPTEVRHIPRNNPFPVKKKINKNVRLQKLPGVNVTEENARISSLMQQVKQASLINASSLAQHTRIFLSPDLPLG